MSTARPIRDPDLVSAHPLRSCWNSHFRPTGAGFLLRNAGAEPCVLLGRLAVAFVEGAGHRLPIKVDATGDRPLPIVLEADVALPAEGSEVPAGLGSVFLVWSNWSGPAPASPFGLLVTPPDGGVIPVPMEPTSLPRCDDPRAPSTVSVGPFEATTGPDPTDPPAIPAETLRLTLVVPDHAVAGSQGADADHRPLIRVRVLRPTDRRRGSATGPPRPGSGRPRSRQAAAARRIGGPSR
jgi:hypothetical protein